MKQDTNAFNLIRNMRHLLIGLGLTTKLPIRSQMQNLAEAWHLRNTSWSNIVYRPPDPNNWWIRPPA